MVTQPLSAFGLNLPLEVTSNETIVHCKGKITAENSEVFQKQIRDLIPESSAQTATMTRSIELRDLPSRTRARGESVRKPAMPQSLAAQAPPVPAFSRCCDG